LNRDIRKALGARNLLFAVGITTLVLLIVCGAREHPRCSLKFKETLIFCFEMLGCG
jgi:hypothetical protein